jgi:hypothetical protein
MAEENMNMKNLAKASDDVELDEDKNSVEDPDDLPDITSELPELRIYSHSPIFYWRPVWVTGFILAIMSGMYGAAVEIDSGRIDTIMPSANPGVFYIAVLLLVIIFTNVKLRGIYSVATVLGILLVAVLLAWFGWWDDILGFIPHLSVHMNMGFYLVFSGALLIIWLLSFFVFDRLTYWSVRPGQMTEEHIIGGGERSYDTRGMLFEKHAEDLFRHIILGLGAGDLKISTTGARKEELYIPNVVFVDKKVRAIQKLIAIKPDDLIEKPVR